LMIGRKVAANFTVVCTLRTLVRNDSNIISRTRLLKTPTLRVLLLVFDLNSPHPQTHFKGAS